MCSSEWIYSKSRQSTPFCESCYINQHNCVIEYHNIQDQAKKDIHNGNIYDGIQKLKITISLRNKVMNEFFENHTNNSHIRFANEFLPNLINMLNGVRNRESAINIWNNEFNKLPNYNI